MVNINPSFNRNIQTGLNKKQPLDVKQGTNDDLKFNIGTLNNREVRTLADVDINSPLEGEVGDSDISLGHWAVTLVKIAGRALLDIAIGLGIEFAAQKVLKEDGDEEKPDENKDIDGNNKTNNGDNTN